MKINVDQAPWLSDPDVQAIMKALPDGTTRFVGGCVRNTLWGMEVGDIDMATQLEPEAVAAALDAHNIRYVPTGIEHGTLTAVIQGRPYEITSLRRDVETDGRRAVIAYTQDWAEDAQRRDFTVNALYADVHGQIFDPSGKGLADIETRRFRFVGDADQRVREDYLRILRYFRFLARYGGQNKVDAEALRACRENRAGLKTLSAERIWSELKKTLSAPDPRRAFRIMQTNDILEVTLPEASNVEGLELLWKLEQSEELTHDPMLRLMAMAARDELATAGLCRRLKMSNAEKGRLLSWAGDATPMSADMSESEQKVAIYKAGQTVARDRALIRAAGADDPSKQKGWMALAHLTDTWELPEFPLTGKDLMKTGMPSGPAIGRALQALEALWIRSGFEANRDKLLMAAQLMNF